ncbi:MAG TPA: hypothetical protein VN889_05815, partial [Solirubrobacteraceae bacterium]|nr:hypothetical protein [Solirubrobacteraceae bacterium]
LGSALLHEMPILSIDEVIERIDAVEMSDVEALAAELFDPQRLSVAAVGPSEQTFRAAIAPFEAQAPAEDADVSTGASNGARSRPGASR